MKLMEVVTCKNEETLTYFSQNHLQIRNINSSDQVKSGNRKLLKTLPKRPFKLETIAKAEELLEETVVVGALVSKMKAYAR